MDTVAIGADHAGFDLKESIKAILTAMGKRVQDCGCASKESVDYPDYAKAVAEAVAQGQAREGVLICGTGIGMCITANKVAGIRAALVGDVFTARMSREHNDANVLCLGAKVVDTQKAGDIVKTWFAAQFEGGRHERRIGKIKELEKGNSGTRC